MATTLSTSLVFSLLLFSLLPHSSSSQSWVRVGYYFSGTGFPISDINSSLFSHLIFSFAYVNSSSFRLSLSSSDSLSLSYFPYTVKLKNPLLVTLLSISGRSANSSVVSEITKLSLNRKAFIESSIATARSFGFDGLDFSLVEIGNQADATNLGTLLEEWRRAVAKESKESNKTELLLTLAVRFSPFLGHEKLIYPVESIRKNLNWVNVMAYAYYVPTLWNFTGASAALYDPTSETSTDYGIKSWIKIGLPADKLVLGLPFYGYIWKLANSSNDSSIGAAANGPGITEGGIMSYKDIKGYIERYKGEIKYDGGYVVNYCVIGSDWIGFDDVEVVSIKVDYAKKMGLLGYFVWQVPYDDNWVLSLAAAQEDLETSTKHDSNRSVLLLALLTPTAAIILIIGAAILWYRRKGKQVPSLGVPRLEKRNDPNLCVFSFIDVVVATNDFAYQNKLGEGGYGPVYRGTLHDGQEIAVKRLSKTSTQGFMEFKNEVMLTAKLQHVNLVRVLGFCIEKQEQMLIYEYMPNKSLDLYIFDPVKGLELDWNKRVQIIEGIVQGLLYLQEYSRLKIIHRDLKASNILLDNEMRPKIADFGMARIFGKDVSEANTGRVVGTYGYVPPEYVKHGIYSTKSDVYNFGVLLLQIISGKVANCYYGLHEDIHLLEYAYELWKDSKYVEFMDPSLDDTNSICKLMRCMQIALLCVQEDSSDRPTTLEVWSMLKNEIAMINRPKRPAFSVRSSTYKKEEGTSSGYGGWSIDNEPITQMKAR